MYLLSPKGWWDNADDLNSTDPGTLSEDDILLLASQQYEHEASAQESAAVPAFDPLQTRLGAPVTDSDASRRMSSSESVPVSVLPRSSALSHHPS